MNQPAFQGIDVVYKGKADNKDIRDLLEKLIPKASDQMREYAKKFKGASELETCKKIFNFLKNDITYLADGNEQVIKMPSALLKKKIGDCKSFSLFTASVLDNLKIPYIITYTSYNENPIPAHVYIVTKSGIIIDAVYGIFNQEKKAKYKYKKNMNVRYMAGINEDSGMGKITLVSKEKRQAVKSKVQTVAKKVTQGAKTNTTNLLNAWLKLGGDRTKLASAISNGASRPIKKLGFLPKLKKIVGNTNISGIGATDIPNEIKGQIISLCTIAGTSIGGSPQGTSVGASMGGIVVAILPSIIGAVKQVPATDVTDAPLENLDLTSDIADETSSETASDTGSKSGFSLTSPKVLIPIALLVAGGIYFATKKK